MFAYNFANQPKESYAFHEPGKLEFPDHVKAELPVAVK